MTIHKTAHKNLIVIVFQKSMLLEKKAWDATLLEVEAKLVYYATCCQLLVTASPFSLNFSNMQQQHIITCAVVAQ